jgi:hypothetical protein
MRFRKATSILGKHHPRECALLAQDASDPRFLTRLPAIQKVAHNIGDEIAVGSAEYLRSCETDSETTNLSL